MRIAYLTTRDPFPPAGGFTLRSYNFLKHLAKTHEVKLYLILSPLDKKRHGLSLLEEHVRVKDRLQSIQKYQSLKKDALLRLAAALFDNNKPFQFEIFHNKMFIKNIPEIEKTSPDLLIFHHERSGQFHHLFKKNIKKIIDIVDFLPGVYSDSIKHSISLSSLLKKIESVRIKAWEKRNLNCFDAGLVVSERDRDKYFDNKAYKKIHVIPNGVDLDYFAYRFKYVDRKKIVFVGSFKHQPNIDGVIHFVNNILSIIQKEIPEASLDIVGLAPEKDILALQKRQNVQVFADVADVRCFMYSANLAICPVTYGSGIQNKILEAMALGTPVLTSETGFEGIRAERGADLLVADIHDHQTFARVAVRALKERTLQERLSHNGRRVVENRYAWERVLSELPGLETF